MRDGRSSSFRDFLHMTKYEAVERTASTSNQAFLDLDRSPIKIHGYDQGPWIASLLSSSEPLPEFWMDMGKNNINWKRFYRGPISRKSIKAWCTLEHIFKSILKILTIFSSLC